MKILHIVAFSVDKLGGIPVVLKELVTRQNKRENIISKILSINALDKEVDSKIVDYVRLNNFKDYIKREQPDIVIFHSFFYLEYWWMARVLLSLNIPYCIEPHGSFGLEALEKSYWKKKFAISLFLSSFVERSKKIIFLNRNEQEKSIFSNKESIIISNGIDIPLNFVKKDNPIIKTRFYFIGRYDINHKGIDVLFDALDILEKSKTEILFDFYGSGDKKQLEYINKRIAKYRYLHVSENGELRGENKNVILSNSVMVLTSRYEGLPMTILESLSYGNPCLVSDGTNMRNEIEYFNLGWGCSLDAKDIAQQILLINNLYIQKHEFYSKNCVQYIEKNYNWENIVDKSIVEISRMISSSN